MARDLELLEDDFHQAIKSVLQQCIDAGIEMRPFFTIRTPTEQARLWRQSRSITEIQKKITLLKNQGAFFLADIMESVGPQFGNPVTNAIPGLSWHQWGEAVDCFWVREGRAEWSTRKQITLNDGRSLNGYRLYAEIAKQSGLTAGGFWSRFKDWPHVQKRNKGVQHFFSLEEVDQAMQNRFG